MDFLKWPLLLQKNMAQLQLQPVTTDKKNRGRKVQLRIDMTPLVDLGFLLITFFVFTTTMSKPYDTELVVPKDTHEIINPTNIPKSKALTILLSGGDNIYYYHGKWEEAVKTNRFLQTKYDAINGIGSIIRKKQKLLGAERNELLLMIKPLDNSSYDSVLKALDEVMVNDVKKYAIMDVTDEEKGLIIRKTNNAY
jgi:biopolymer transport protein ExbD